MGSTKIEVISADGKSSEPENAKPTASEKAAAQAIGLLGKDEAELLKAYRKAKKLGYADIAVTIQEGKRVKLWLTEKIK